MIDGCTVLKKRDAITSCWNGFEMASSVFTVLLPYIEHASTDTYLSSSIWLSKSQELVPVAGTKPPKRPSFGTETQGMELIVQKPTNDSSIQYQLTMKQKYNKSFRSTGWLVLDGDDRECIYARPLHVSMNHHLYSFYRSDQYEVIRHHARSGTGSWKRYVPFTYPV